jgi:hypothetical protein
MRALAPETRTRPLIGRNMSKFLEDSKFFWTEYHSGKINIIMHLVSFSVLFYGLAIKSVPLVLIGLFVSMRWDMPITTSSCITETRNLVSE